MSNRLIITADNLPAVDVAKLESYEDLGDLARETQITDDAIIEPAVIEPAVIDALIAAADADDVRDELTDLLTAAASAHEAGDRSGGAEGEVATGSGWPLLDELRALQADLHASGLTAELGTSRDVLLIGTSRDVLLIGTVGGGIITAALSPDRRSWWANGAFGFVAHDLTGRSLTAAVHGEVARHARLAAAAEHQHALLDDAQRLEGIA